jgi:hypothetical protein
MSFLQRLFGGDPSGINAQVRHLKDRKWYVRRKAAEALGRSVSPEAIDPLIRVLLNDDTEEVRCAAARSLAQAKDERAFVPLINALESDPASYVRQTAAQSLGDFQDAMAVDPLIKALSDPSASVRISVVQALGELKDQRALEPIRNLPWDSVDSCYTKTAIMKIEGREDVDNKLFEAVSEGNISAAKVWIAKGANVNYITDPNTGATSVLSESISKNPNIDITQLLLENGADPNNGWDWERRSPLMIACAIGDLEIARSLISAGADVNYASHYLFDKTPLMFAAELGNADVVKELIANGASVDQSAERCTAMTYAIDGRHIDVIRVLRDSGVDMNAKSEDGLTPSEYAAKSGYSELAPYLE